MSDHLNILHEKTLVGRLSYQRDTLALDYLPEWQYAEQAFPVSLSLPLGQSRHDDSVIRNFITGLLPDNGNVLESWGKRFHVSPRNPFALLRYLGEDCAGALQFVRDDRLDAILSGELDSLVLLSKEELSHRITELAQIDSAIPVFDHEGNFSLAGAQRKTALHLKNQQWYLPGGSIPTTHILKPQLADFEQHGLNEHTCLALALASGIPTARSHLQTIADQTVIVVTRYDRRETDQGIRRVHQEDICQALSIPPENKYQRDSGPSPMDVVELLRRHSDQSSKDIDTFLCSLAYNWAIGGTDAHAKNYSLLHSSDAETRFAPLYDLSSWLPYRDPKSRKVKMAMKYGHTYHLHKIDRHQWETLASECKLKPKRVLPLVADYLEQLRDEALPQTHALVSQKHGCDFLDTLIDKISNHTTDCLDSLVS